MDFARSRERAGALLRSTFSPINGITAATAVLLTTVAAVAGTVATDVLKEPWTAIVLGVLTLGLLVAIVGRSRVRRATGTIFHVQVLDEALGDLRKAGRESAEARRMAVRSVVRWVDWDTRTVDGVIDAVDVARDVRSALEIQLNTDAPETGYALAPVVPWPLGLAIGMELPLPRALRLVELETAGIATQSIDLTSAASTPIRVAPNAGDPAGRVGVLLGFTDQAARYLDEQAVLDAVWAARGVTTTYRVTTPDGRAHGPSDPLTVEQLDGLGAAVARELAEIRKRHAGRELVVLGCITKIMSVAIGWHLAQEKCRFFRDTHLLHWDGVALVPMRVRDSQPAHAPTPAPAGAHA